MLCRLKVNNHESITIMTSYFVAQSFVEGTREEIVGMLNTILRNVGVDSVITDEDDVASANHKIRIRRAIFLLD